MKKLTFIAATILALALSFSACKKKDDAPSLVGTWTSINVRNQTYYDGKLISDHSEAMGTDDIVITFNADNTFIGIPKGGPNEYGTYIADGKNLIFHNVDGEIDSFTYTLRKDEFDFISAITDEEDPSDFYTETITYKRK